MPWYSASIKAGILLNSVVQKHFGTNSHWPKGKVKLNYMFVRGNPQIIEKVAS